MLYGSSNEGRAGVSDRAKKIIGELSQYNIFESNDPIKIYPVGKTGEDDAIGIYYSIKDGYRTFLRNSLEIDETVRNLDLDDLIESVSLFVDLDFDEKHLRMISNYIKALSDEFNRGTFYIGAKSSTVLVLKDPREMHKKTEENREVENA